MPRFADCAPNSAKQQISAAFLTSTSISLSISEQLCSQCHDAHLQPSSHSKWWDRIKKESVCLTSPASVKQKHHPFKAPLPIRSPLSTSRRVFFSNGRHDQSLRTLFFTCLKEEVRPSSSADISRSPAPPCFPLSKSHGPKNLRWRIRRTGPGWLFGT